MADTGNYIELVLSCGSWQEAQRIADHLLQKRLITRAELLPVKSKFTWKGELEAAEEISLIMLSLREFFDAVEAEVRQLHSYEAFVLRAVPVEQLSAEAIKWLREATQGLTGKISE